MGGLLSSDFVFRQDVFCGTVLAWEKMFNKIGVLCENLVLLWFV